MNHEAGNAPEPLNRRSMNLMRLGALAMGVLTSIAALAPAVGASTAESSSHRQAEIPGRVASPNSLVHKDTAKRLFNKLDDALTSQNPEDYDEIFANENGLGRSTVYALELQAKPAGSITYEEMKVRQAIGNKTRSSLLVSGKIKEAGAERDIDLVVKVNEGITSVGDVVPMISFWQELTPEQAEEFKKQPKEFKRFAKGLPEFPSASEIESRIDLICPELPTSDDPETLLAQSFKQRSFAVNNSNENCLSLVVDNTDSDLGRLLRQKMAINVLGDKVDPEQRQKYEIIKIINSDFSNPQMRIVEAEIKETYGDNKPEKYVTRFLFIPKPLTAGSNGITQDALVWVITQQQKPVQG